MIHSPEKIKPSDADALYPYLSEKTKMAVGVFMESGDTDFAYELARMSVLVDYRKHFIGVPEFAEEPLQLVYGWEKTPILYFLTAFVACLGVVGSAILLRRKGKKL